MKIGNTVLGQIVPSIIFLQACASAGVDSRIRSVHFRDGAFHNSNRDYDEPTFWGMVKMRWNTDYADWPHWVDEAVDRSPLARVNGDELRITFVNHATFLIQTSGYNILTDPVYTKRVSPFPFYGPERVHNPGIPLKSLPKIDIILISHDHYDHLDTNAANELIRRDNPRIYMGLGMAKHLENATNGVELDWWETRKVDKGFHISFTEVQHFSGRGLGDQDTTLWGAFVLTLNGKKIYFGGDSGYGSHYERTYQQFGPMDIAFIPIGAYAPRSFMEPVHLDPKQAVRVHQDLRSKKSIAMHYGTFRGASAESREEPVTLLRQEIGKANLDQTDFITLPVGVAVEMKQD